MRPLLSSFIILALLLGAIWIGARLRRTLPQHHLSKESQDAIRVSVALIATMAALVLSLLITAAKNSFDTQSTQVKRITADIILADNLLAKYGPEAQPIRQHLRDVIGAFADRLWRQESVHQKRFAANASAEAIDLEIRALSPHTNIQHSLQTSVINVVDDAAQIRLLLFVESGNALPTPFLIVLVLWLIIIFASFSLFAELNPTVLVFMCLFALSAAGAIFLILELNEPFAKLNLMSIPSAPLRDALAPLGH